MPIVQRVEKHIFKRGDSFYKILDEFTYRAKNLYNYALYKIKDEEAKTGKFISEYDLDKILNKETCWIDKEGNVHDDPPYKQMPSSAAQHVLKGLYRNWKGYFAAIKDYKKHPEKYKSAPKPPKFLPKEKENPEARYVFTLTYVSARLKDGMIVFPKPFYGDFSLRDFTIKPHFIEKEFESFQQVRFVPKRDVITVELIYRVKISDLREDNGRYLGIDLGVNNFATVANNFGERPFIINGKPLRAINQFYAKMTAKYQEISKTRNKKYYTHRLAIFTRKKNNRVETFIHRACKYIVDYAVKNNVNTIIVGKNDGWKQCVNLGAKTNQVFVAIPYTSFIEKMKYKAENVGIKVIETEEAYTSGTSSLDDELPTKEFYNKSRRKYRGLFVSNEGVEINADVNAAYQIIKKVVPDMKGIVGKEYCPVIVTLA